VGVGLRVDPHQKKSFWLAPFKRLF
jgi:hypothetical protein